MGGEDSYGDEYYGEKRDLGGLGEDDRLEVNMDDLEDDDSDEGEAINLNKPPEESKEKTETQLKGQEETKVEEELNNSNGSGSAGSGSGNSENATKSTGNSSGGASEKNLFAIGESHDKGLADMETGSEVYMSELLVS